MSLLHKIWYQKHPLFYLLAPFSGLYRFALFFKNLAYRLHLKKITHPPVPTIVVGNLTVGGTGKTPLLIALAQFLSQQGYKPGIVSRGYGGKPNQLPFHVYPHSDPQAAGDEPVLMARKTSCPVVVDPKRARAVSALLATYGCTLILSDDGLQHTALGRDIEIVVVDGKRGFGNGWCLPAGPLREPTRRLETVDFIVVRTALAEKEALGEKMHRMQFLPGTPYNLMHPEKNMPAEWMKGKKTLHAVAGIGNPQAFFDQLRSIGCSIQEHPFPDHHHYTAQDIDFGPDAVLIMTEKDAVKLEKFAQENHWCLPGIAVCDSMLPHLLRKITAFHIHQPGSYMAKIPDFSELTKKFDIQGLVDSVKSAVTGGPPPKAPDGDVVAEKFVELLQITQHALTAHAEQAKLLSTIHQKLNALYTDVQRFKETNAAVGTPKDAIAAVPTNEAPLTPKKATEEEK
jgi:tetraacyldisaccharide 4'-kinase